MAEFPASETTRTRLKPMVSPIVNAETFIPLLHTEMVDAVSVLLFIFTLLVSASLFCKALFSRNKQRSKDIKHLTTASEIKSCHGHLVQKHKPQEMITQYACNKPASWPLHIRLSAAKTRFTQSKFRMLHVLHCVVLVNFAREKKRKRTTVQADSQGDVSHYHELMSRVWPACQRLFLTESLNLWVFFQFVVSAFSTLRRVT